MTLDKLMLEKWEESAHVVLTTEQKTIILERFGSKPGDGYEWSEQDIAEQVRKIMRNHPEPLD